MKKKTSIKNHFSLKICLLLGSNQISEENELIQNRIWGFKRWLKKMFENEKLRESQSFKEFISNENYKPAVEKTQWFPTFGDVMSYFKSTNQEIINDIHQILEKFTGVKLN